MDLDFIRKTCMSLPGTTEQIQWESDILFKVGGKMFVVCGSNTGSSVSLKANPEKIDELIEIEGVVPAPYLARNKWVSIQNKNGLRIQEIKNLVKESYELVFNKLPKKVRDEINKNVT